MERREHAGPVELRAMQSLAERVAPVTGYHLIGDLAWNWTLFHDRPDENPTAVWYEGADVLAWGWIESGADLMLQVDPARPEVADDVLDWAARKVDGPLQVEVCDTESAIVAALQRRGAATPDSPGPFMLCLGRALTDLPKPSPLPAGYVIRELDGPGDAERRAAVHRAAFGSTRVTGERHTAMMATWPYDRAFDLVVEAPDGDFAAYCQGWYDKASRTGEFDPVGTHPDHRRRGLGRAICTAVLHAFAAAGGARALVYARGDEAYPVPKLVYESIGFRAYARTRHYTVAAAGTAPPT